MSRAWLFLLVAALALAVGALLALKHADDLSQAARGAELQSQDAATRFSSAGVPLDLDTQMAGLDHRRTLMAEAGTWREWALFLLVWVVVLGAGAYVAHAIREEPDSDGPPRPPPAGVV